MGVGEGFTPGTSPIFAPTTEHIRAQGGQPLGQQALVGNLNLRERDRKRKEFGLPKAPALRHPRLFCGKSDGWGESAIS